MRYFREIYGYTSTEIAQNLGITADEYLHLETGEQLLSEGQAEQLALLFKVQKDFLLEAAEQLDLLLARNAIIELQKEKIAHLQLRLQNAPNEALNKI